MSAAKAKWKVRPVIQIADVLWKTCLGSLVMINSPLAYVSFLTCSQGSRRAV